LSGTATAAKRILSVVSVRGLETSGAVSLVPVLEGRRLEPSGGNPLNVGVIISDGNENLNDFFLQFDN